MVVRFGEESSGAFVCGWCWNRAEYGRAYWFLDLIGVICPSVVMMLSVSSEVRCRELWSLG